MAEALDDSAFVELVAEVARVRVNNRDLFHDEDLTAALVSYFVGCSTGSLAQPVEDLEVSEGSRLLRPPSILNPRLTWLLL